MLRTLYTYILRFAAVLAGLPAVVQAGPFDELRVIRGGGASLPLPGSVKARQLHPSFLEFPALAEG